MSKNWNNIEARQEAYLTFMERLTDPKEEALRQAVLESPKVAKEKFSEIGDIEIPDDVTVNFIDEDAVFKTMTLTLPPLQTDEKVSSAVLMQQLRGMWQHWNSAT